MVSYDKAREARGCCPWFGGRSPSRVWGAAGMVPVVAPGPFAQIEVSSSGEAICGMRGDSTVDCWVYHYVAGNPEPAASPP